MSGCYHRKEKLRRIKYEALVTGSQSVTTYQSGKSKKSPTNSLDDLRFLIGEWEGTGGGGPGSGKGTFSFALDLQDKAIVRRNQAEYPATADRPAVRHDDHFSRAVL